MKILQLAFFVGLSSCLLRAVAGAEDDEPCPAPAYNGVLPEPGLDYLVPTGQYSFQLEQAQGAQGDVVGVTVSLTSTLHSPGRIAGFLSVCHDASLGEIVGEPAFSDELLSILGPTGVAFWPVSEREGVLGDQRGNGFLIDIDFVSDGYEERIASGEPLPIATVYYRLTGEPGTSSPLRFCDGELARFARRCNLNRIYTYADALWDYLSTVNVSGSLGVVVGPVTQPEPPPQPPNARVYPEFPTAERVNFQVRVAGAIVQPGAKDVPVEVYVSSDLEYSGVVVPIDFDERYLRLSRAVDHFITGGVLVDNRDESQGSDAGEGHAVIYSGMGVGHRRLAGESEELKAATLYFDVLEEAGQVDEIELSVSSVADARNIVYSPWIAIHYGSGTVATDPSVVRAQVDPILVSPGLLKIQQRPIVLGDVNVDYALDVSDAVSILSYLYLGRVNAFCLEAADFNADNLVGISDPIALLNFLFLGGGSAPIRDVICQ